jgi:hypothetical protein
MDQVASAVASGETVHGRESVPRQSAAIAANIVATVRAVSSFVMEHHPVANVKIVDSALQR